MIETKTSQSRLIHLSRMGDCRKSPETACGKSVFYVLLSAPYDKFEEYRRNRYNSMCRKCMKTTYYKSLSK